MSYDFESMQQLHNTVITNNHNPSGNNNQKGTTSDSTELLLRGALAIAEGRELGMSDDEIIDAMSRLQ